MHHEDEFSPFVREHLVSVNPGNPENCGKKNTSNFSINQNGLNSSDLQTMENHLGTKLS